MTLPHDTARCLGRRGETECADCVRRTDRPPRPWPIDLTWMVPPIARPCMWRVERQEETSE